MELVSELLPLCFSVLFIITPMTQSMGVRDGVDEVGLEAAPSCCLFLFLLAPGAQAMDVRVLDFEHALLRPILGLRP